MGFFLTSIAIAIKNKRYMLTSFLFELSFPSSTPAIH